jgi:hypothetical protein
MGIPTCIMMARGIYFKLQLVVILPRPVDLATVGRPGHMPGAPDPGSSMRLSGCPLTLAGLPSPALKVSGLPLATEPTAASLSSQPRSSSSTSQLPPDAGDIRYPATLPVSGVQPQPHWQPRRFLAELAWHARTAGASRVGLERRAFAAQAAPMRATACHHRGNLRRYPHRHARMHTKYAAGSLACIRVSGP